MIKKITLGLLLFILLVSCGKNGVPIYKDPKDCVEYKDPENKEKCTKYKVPEKKVEIQALLTDRV